MIIKILNRIKIGFRFYIRAFKLRKGLTKIDKKSPFKGMLSEFGYHQFSISIRTLNVLKKLYHKKNNTHLSKDEEIAVKEIFAYAKREVRNYLGKHAFLDGVNWMITKKNKTHKKKRYPIL